MWRTEKKHQQSTGTTKQTFLLAFLGEGSGVIAEGLEQIPWTFSDLQNRVICIANAAHEEIRGERLKSSFPWSFYACQKKQCEKNF